METTYTKSEVEKVIRAYHDWLSQFGAPDDDGNDRDVQLAEINVYSHLDEDADQMPFSEAVGIFFQKHVEVDEPGHPIYIPFNEALAELE